MLVQAMEDSKLQYMYVVDHWKKPEYAVAKLSGLFPVMIELTDANVAHFNKLALQQMLHCDVGLASKFTVALGFFCVIQAYLQA